MRSRPLYDCVRDRHTRQLSPVTTRGVGSRDRHTRGIASNRPCSWHVPCSSTSCVCSRLLRLLKQQRYAGGTGIYPRSHPPFCVCGGGMVWGHVEDEVSSPPGLICYQRRLCCTTCAPYPTTSEAWTAATTTPARARRRTGTGAHPLTCSRC